MTYIAFVSCIAAAAARSCCVVVSLNHHFSAYMSRNAREFKKTQKVEERERDDPKQMARSCWRQTIQGQG
jgi:hypothetical protein